MGKKIKILFAINCMNIGGAPTVVYEQIKHIDKEKFEPYLLTLYPSKKANFFSKLDFLNQGKIVQFILKNRSIFDFKTLWQIYIFLRKERFDVVYTHLFLANLLVRGLAVLARVPIILSFEHSTYFNKRKWQIIADKMLSVFTDKIIVSTKGVLEFTSQQEKINSKKFFIIPNSVSLPDKSSIDPEKIKSDLNIPRDAFVVMSLGRFSEEKGQKFLIRAAQEITKKKSDIYFILVGHGPLEKNLKKEIEVKGIGEKFKLVVDPEKAKQYYFIGDIFVLPSIREGQSIVTYEAMRAGLPVIVPRLEGLQDIIKEGENGLMFDAGDVAQIEKQIFQLYKNPEVRDKFKKVGSDSVVDFSIEKIIKRLENLILDLFENEK